MKIKINKGALKQLEQAAAKHFSAGVKVPLDGTEADAIRSVSNQLRRKGTVPNAAAVRKLVRDTRAEQTDS